MASGIDKKIELLPGAVRNEGGMALIIVLIMLFLLSILGASMLASSTSELKIAGNYRNSEESFYAAEAALDVGATLDTIYTSIIPDSATESWPVSGSGVELSSSFATTGTSSPNRDYNRITIPGTNSTADVKVEFITKSNLAAGSGMQEDSGLSAGGGFKGNNFAVNVIANGPNNSQAQVESQIQKVVQQL
jgi:Tfp pilus assembly protein PilX